MWRNVTSLNVTFPNVTFPNFTSPNVTLCGLGNYSRLACELHFVRSLGYYIIHIYIPSSLIVVLSWVSFWLHRDAAPARVALGVMTVLTMTTLISSTNAALPKISYLKSIDVYLVMCFVMVFAAILEYAAVSYIGRTCWPMGRRSKRKEKDQTEWSGEEETAYFRLRKGRKGADRWRTHLELEIKVIAGVAFFFYQRRHHLCHPLLLSGIYSNHSLQCRLFQLY